MAAGRSKPARVQLWLDLLGGFAARDGAGRDIAIGSRKAQALLAFLALSPGKPQPREKLTGLLWSDRGEAQARSSLRQALSELRRTLPKVEPPFLKTQRDSAWLDPEAVEVDAITLERLVSSEEPKDLAQAAELYKGDLLDGLDVRDAAFEEWRRGERERLREWTSQALTRLLDQQTGEQAITTGRRLLALDPLNEATHRRLLQLYADAGDRSSAIHQYEVCRDLLRTELGLEPEAQTEEFLETLRHGQIRTAPARLAVCEAKTAPPLSSRPSIAVLPFTNMSADSEQQYFSDGITEDIMTELSRFGSLDVLARQSTFVLRDRAEDAREAVRDLGTQYLLTGSVRKVGDRIRLTAQLVDVNTQKHIWTDRYDRELIEVFSIQDELVHAIVATLVGRLKADSLERTFRKLPENLMAYDYYLQGLWFEGKYDLESCIAGREAIEKAIATDPTFARPYGLLAHFMMTTGWFNGSAEAPSDEILEIAKRAVELDPTDGDCFAKLAVIHIDRREHEEARRNLEAALHLNPHDSSTWSHYAWYLVTIGEPEKALEYLDRRAAVDPYLPNWHWEIRGEALYDLGRYEEAVQVLEQQANRHFFCYGQSAACYGQLERKEEAARCWQKVIAINPKATLSSIIEGFCYACQRDADHWLEGLRKAVLSD